MNYFGFSLRLTACFRRTFPLIRTRISGLEDNALYSIHIEFRIADAYKYRFLNGEWKTQARADSSKTQSVHSVTYVHPDSPNFGSHWKKESIAFSKLKLTNNENTSSADAVFLKSLNKYNPIIHVYKLDGANNDNKTEVFSCCFTETQFIAVTAYQNEQVGYKHSHY